MVLIPVRQLPLAAVLVGTLACASSKPWKPVFDARCDCGPKQGLDVAERAPTSDSPTYTLAPTQALDATLLAKVIETEIYAEGGGTFHRADPVSLTVALLPRLQAAAMAREAETGDALTTELRAVHEARATALANGDEFAALQLTQQFWSTYRSATTRLEEDLDRAVAAAAATCGELHPAFGKVLLRVLEHLKDLDMSAPASMMPYLRRELADWMVAEAKCKELAAPILPTIAPPFVFRRRAEWLALAKP